MLLLLGSGCGGVNASRSVSPLDFLIPGGGGLMRGLLYVPPAAVPANFRELTPVAEPPSDAPILLVAPAQMLAQVQ